MIPQRLLHPDHIIPTAQLEAALMKMAHGVKAHALMEGHAVRVGVGDTGVEV